MAAKHTNRANLLGKDLLPNNFNSGLRNCQLPQVVLVIKPKANLQFSCVHQKMLQFEALTQDLNGFHSFVTDADASSDELLRDESRKLLYSTLHKVVSLRQDEILMEHVVI